MRAVSIVFVSLLFFTKCGKNSAQQFLDENEQADSLVQFLNGLDPFLVNHDTVAVKKTLDSLEEHINESTGYRLLCKYLNVKGVLFTIMGRYDSALHVLHKSLKLAEKRDTSLQLVIDAKIYLADVLQQKKDYDSALVYAREALYLANKNNKGGLELIYLRLAEIHNEMDDHEAWKKYIFEGFKSSATSDFKATFANEIASYYDERKMYDSGIHFFRQYVIADSIITNPLFHALKIGNLGYFLVQNNQVNEGLQYLSSAQATYRSLGYLTGDDMYNMATAHNKAGNYYRAALYLDSALELSKQEKALGLISKIWKLTAKNYKDQGEYRLQSAALDSALVAQRVEADSSKAGVAKDLEVRYAVRVKDDQIHLLSMTNEANERIRSQQRTIILFMIAGGIMLLISSILILRRRQLLVKLRESELQQRLLRIQMEPHFLFNILADLQGLIRTDQKEKASRFLGKFARYLRLNLENSRTGWVLLAEEIESLESYLILQQMRHENSFDYTISVYDGYAEDNVLIPPMLIQPFVENAIIHGFSRIRYKGRLNLIVDKPGLTVKCIIDDNGGGIVEDNGKQKASLSTTITQERLDALSHQTGQPASLQIIDKSKSEQKTGVRIELIIPVKLHNI